MENFVDERFPVYNGSLMTKREILQYFLAIFKLYSEFEDAMDRKKDRTIEIRSTEMNSKRHVFPTYHMDPPTGLAAWSNKNRARYQRWLEEAPAREAELQRKNAEEDIRLAGVQRKLSELYSDQEKDSLLIRDTRSKLDSLLGLGIIPTDYSNPQALKRLCSYFIDCRANTLTDAINLYHQEMQWNRTQTMIQKQGIDTQAALQNMQVQQAIHLQDMKDAQKQHFEEMQAAMDDTKRAAEEARYYSEMNFWLNR